MSISPIVVTAAPNSEEAPKQTPYEVFWGLGDNWWKQFIDGKYHQYGPRVFDTGAHQGPVEPGFYDSLRSACLYASEHLDPQEKLTIPFYRQIHRLACAHFNGKATSTEMTAKWAGHFRPAKYCQMMRDKFYFELPGVDYIEMRKKLVLYRQIDIFMSKQVDIPAETIASNCLEQLGITIGEAFECMDHNVQLREEEQAKIVQINQTIEQKIGKVATVTSDRYKMRIDYHLKASEVKSHLKKVFDQFNEEMSRAVSEEEKIRAIANLFQLLEWMHPFHDGQGRTDLILLATLLSAHGLNPPILESPYVSTFCLFDEWVIYLTRGMEAWRQEQSRLTK